MERRVRPEDIQTLINNRNLSDCFDYTAKSKAEKGRRPQTVEEVESSEYRVETFSQGLDAVSIVAAKAFLKIENLWRKERSFDDVCCANCR
jgi:hypothetical protein